MILSGGIMATPFLQLPGDFPSSNFGDNSFTLQAISGELSISLLVT